MSTSARTGTTGVKVVITLTIFLLLTAAAILLQIRYRGFEGPLSDNLLILILINANFLLLAAVIFLIGRILWKLSVERRSRVLGAKFRTRLIVAFVSLSFIPTILLFIFGSGMYTRAIERLFSLRLETNLQEAVSVSQAFYDRMKEQALLFARQVGRQVSEDRLLSRDEPSAVREALVKKTAEYGIGAVELFGPNRAVISRVTTERLPARIFTATPADLVGQAFSGEEAASVSDLGRNGEIVRAVVPVFDPLAERHVGGAVAVSYLIPSNITHKIDSLRLGYAEYRSSFKNKELLKMSYRLGFLAVMLSLLLAAIWVALRVAGGITGPIRSLAEGTIEVSRGNLDYRIEEQSRDEVGMLVDSFNRMTADLKHSREQLRQEVANREIILTNIDAGVVSVDRAGRIVTVNDAASRILGIVPSEVTGRRYDEAFGFMDLGPVRGLFRSLEEGLSSAEKELSLTVRGRTLTLRTRISTLLDSANAITGFVITFDDLTELLRAKKAETWQDVARKIAHEVKNPLTPIKLSAERLRKKFNERSPDFEQVFDDLSLTIIQQVDGLKGLLDEFSEYARMPRPHLRRQPLAPVVDGVVQLYASAHRNIAFGADIPADLPDLLLDQEQMKRVFINLLKNAVEVIEGSGSIRVSARLSDDRASLRIEVTDSGPGIPAEDMARLFEPYFSRKRKGGGLGLAIVDRIIADHHGTIHAEQNEPHGARFVIVLPLK